MRMGEENEWVGLFFRYFAVSESFCVSSYFFHLISAFPKSHYCMNLDKNIPKHLPKSHMMNGDFSYSV